MKFCSECGTELSDSTAFCSNCGRKVESSASDQSNHSSEQSMKSNQAETNQPTRQKEKKEDFATFIKRHKMLLSIGLGVALVILAGYFTLSFINSPDRYVNGVVDAIEADDYESLAGSMYFADTEEKISKESIEVYVNYLKENKNRLDQVKRDLQEQSELLEEDDQTISDFSTYWDEMYLVKKDGFLKDTYRVYVIPSYVTIESTLDGLMLSNDLEEDLHTFSERESSFEVGPLVRGFHQFTFTYEGEWMKLEEQREHYIADKSEYVSPEFDVDYLTFETGFQHDYEEKLIMSGNEVSDPIFNEEIGPFLLDEQSTYEYQVDFPWGTMSTGEQPIDSEYVRLDFQVNEELAEQLADGLQNHYETVLTSFETRDFSLLEDMNAGLRNSYENNYESMYGTFDSNDEWYSGLHYKNFNIHPTMMSFGKDDQGEWHVTVPVTEEEMIVNSYAEPSESDLADYRNNNRHYQLNYRDGEWVVVDHLSMFGFPDSEQTFDYTYDGDVRLLETTVEEAAGDPGKVIPVRVGEYVEHLVEAINAGDYSLVSPYILSGSSLESDQQSLVKRLYEAGTTEELKSFEVLSVEESGDGWKAKSREEITINYESGESETNTYEWTYTVVEKDGEYFLSKIE
uniref:TcaA NTF2-like domain-containing protein n=1 Tax=uncultured Allobacillus sp. TaxID=1638025 RepID=UPI002596D8CD|nr:zinc-ribbon domain-containing protein [uncultured Allobacillus sp.]